MRVEIFGWLAFFELGYFLIEEYEMDSSVAFTAVEIRNHVEQLLVNLFSLAVSADDFGKKDLKQALGRIVDDCLTISMEAPDFLINKGMVEELLDNENHLELTSGIVDAQGGKRKKRKVNYSWLADKYGYDAVEINSKKRINYTQLSKMYGFDAIEIDTREYGNDRDLKDILEKNLISKIDMEDHDARTCSKALVEMLNLSLRIVDASNDMHLVLHYGDDPRFLHLLLRELQYCEKLLSRINILTPILES